MSKRFSSCYDDEEGVRCWCREGRWGTTCRFPESYNPCDVQVRDSMFVLLSRQIMYSVPSRVWTPSSPLSCNFCRLRDDSDDDGQLDSIAPKAQSVRSNPTARRRRNHLEVCKSCMTKVTRVSTLSMGTEYRWCWQPFGQLDSIAGRVGTMTHHVSIGVEMRSRIFMTTLSVFSLRTQTLRVHLIVACKVQE